MCTQFQFWFYDITAVQHKMFDLLHKEVPYVQTGDIQVEFENMKGILTSERFIRLYDPELYPLAFMVWDTCWSSTGRCVKTIFLEKGICPVHIV